MHTPAASAAKAGLKVGDVVTAVDDQRVDNADALIAAVRSHAPGEQVKVSYTRGGTTNTTDVTLGSSTADRPRLVYGLIGRGHDAHRVALIDPPRGVTFRGLIGPGLIGTGTWPMPPTRCSTCPRPGPGRTCSAPTAG